MSDLGVRTAARKEAAEVFIKPRVGDMQPPDYIAQGGRMGFEAGAVWAAGRLPTRDEIAEAIASGYDAKYERKFPVNDHDLRAADAVLALIQSRMEGK